MLVSLSYHFDLLLENSRLKICLVRLDIDTGLAIQTKFVKIINVQQEFNKEQISFVWDSTGKMADDRNNRNLIRITLIFTDSTYLTLELQVRFYKKFGKHYTWGRKLDYCKAFVSNKADNIDQSIIPPTLYGK